MRASSVESIIIETLDCENCHLTAKEILEQIQPQLPAVNPSTVYRALERLATAGKISVSDIGHGAAVYEIVHATPHHHLACQQCGQIYSLDRALVDHFLKDVYQSSGFKVTTNHLVIFGICPDCQSND